jgi:hypothetical protein
MEDLFSLVVAWDRDFLRTRDYVRTNEIETAGMGAPEQTRYGSPALLTR